MQIEDMIYDAAVLKMGVCLERFLERQLNVAQSDRGNSMMNMINDYVCMINAGRDDKEKTRKWMREIWKARNNVAHPNPTTTKEVARPPVEKTDPIFKFESFKKIRQTGRKLDEWLKDTLLQDRRHRSRRRGGLRHGDPSGFQAIRGK